MANPFNKNASRVGVSRKDAKAMGNMLAGEKNARGSVYSQTMRAPKKERLFSSRALLALLLLIALPPVGIGFVWRKRVFLSRGRILLTTVSTLIMVVMLIPLMPSGGLETVTPAPSIPSSFSYIKGVDAQADLARIAQISDNQAGASASTVVYTSDGDAHYHSGAQCDSQALSLALTISQAAERSLTPCPNCQPPSL